MARPMFRKKHCLLNTEICLHKIIWPTVEEVGVIDL